MEEEKRIDEMIVCLITPKRSPTAAAEDLFQIIQHIKQNRVSGTFLEGKLKRDIVEEKT